MAQQEVDVMVDFETLGVSRDSVLLSSGIIVFTPDIILEEHECYYSVRGQIFAGQVVMKSTVDWWIKTDPDAFNDLLFRDGGVYPEVYLPKKLGKIRKDYKVKNIWSRGSMDFEILNYHLEEEFPYWMAKDCRTLDVFMKMGKNNHNALDDARNQVAHVKGVMKRWNAPVVEEE